MAKAKKTDSIPAEKKKKSRKELTQALARGKRKEAIARAVVKNGKGIIRVNNVLLDSINNEVMKELVKEPLQFVEQGKYDVDITVKGGGVMGQAQAARVAVAKALVAFTGSKELRNKMIQFDRSLLVEDPRRVEPKKFKGPKARARFTKSYR